MRRRKPLPPDTRPDWRDPNMPVCRNYTMRDGTKKLLADPDWEQEYRTWTLERTPAAQHWSNDPTYNLRKPRR